MDRGRRSRLASVYRWDGEENVPRQAIPPPTRHILRFISVRTRFFAAHRALARTSTVSDKAPREGVFEINLH